MAAHSIADYQNHGYDDVPRHDASLVMEGQKGSFFQCTPSIEQIKRYSQKTVQNMTLYLEGSVIVRRWDATNILQIRAYEFNLSRQKSNNDIIFFKGNILNEGAQPDLVIDVMIKNGKGKFVFLPPASRISPPPAAPENQSRSLFLVKR